MLLSKYIEDTMKKYKISLRTLQSYCGLNFQLIGTIIKTNGISLNKLEELCNNLNYSKEDFLARYEFNIKCKKKSGRKINIPTIHDASVFDSHGIFGSLPDWLIKNKNIIPLIENKENCNSSININSESITTSSNAENNIIPVAASQCNTHINTLLETSTCSDDDKKLNTASPEVNSLIKSDILKIFSKFCKGFAFESNYNSRPFIGSLVSDKYLCSLSIFFEPNIDFNKITIELLKLSKFNSIGYKNNIFFYLAIIVANSERTYYEYQDKIGNEYGYLLDNTRFFVVNRADLINKNYKDINDFLLIIQCDINNAMYIESEISE